MSKLSDLRKDLVDTLADAELDLNLYAYIPARMALPGAFVAAGGPDYITVEEGVNVFGEKTVRFEVVVCVQTGDNLSETSALDELIEGTQAALEEAGWLVESISQPSIQEFNNANALVTVITVTDTVAFN